MNDSRTKKVLKNAKVNVSFYLLSIILAFFSRKIFLECLGDEYVGLTGTLTNILGYLNLAELGFASALIFNLYKPLYNEEHGTITDIISFYGYFNRKIGLFILGAGAIFSLFIPVIFKTSEISLPLVFFAFYVILITSTIAYFVNYRQILLFADQKSYVFNSITQTGQILKTIAQIAITIKTGSYYAWLIIELVFGILISIAINVKINLTYPWLNSRVRDGRAIKERYRGIMDTTRKVFVHKIKDFLLTQNDQFIVFLFLSLKMVAFYGNYVMVFSRILTLTNQMFAGTESSVGNLLAQNDHKRTMSVFWELSAVKYVVGGTLCFALYKLTSPFISVWLSDEYILDNGITFLLTLNLYIMITRGVVDNFNSALGHYQDTWAAWVELGLNMGITLIGGYFWGLYGILLGKTAGLVTIVLFWKPYYLFKKGFREPYSLYWRHTLGYMLSFIATIFIAEGIIGLIGIDPAESFIWWIVAGAAYTSVFGIIYFMIVMLCCKGGNALLQRIFNKKRNDVISSLQ